MATRFAVSPTANEIVRLRQGMDRMLNESFNAGRTRTIWTSPKASRSQTPIALDVYANDDEAVVLAAVPGVDPENIEISIERNTLTLKGEIFNSATSEEAKGATWYLHELQSGSFQRSLTLPWDIDVDTADATFQHGLLRLTLPKAQADKPKQIRVRVEQIQSPSIESEATTEAIAE